MLREEASPAALRCSRSPVCMTEMFATYSVMMPFWVGTGGGLQLIRKVLELVAISLMPSGGAVGTASKEIIVNST